jgi:hypothetical protein
MRSWSLLDQVPWVCAENFSRTISGSRTPWMSHESSSVAYTYREYGQGLGSLPILKLIDGQLMRIKAGAHHQRESSTSASATDSVQHCHPVILSAAGAEEEATSANPLGFGKLIRGRALQKAAHSFFFSVLYRVTLFSLEVDDKNSSGFTRPVHVALFIYCPPSKTRASLPAHQICLRPQGPDRYTGENLI